MAEAFDKFLGRFDRFWMWGRRSAYRRVFGGPAGKRVLADILDFAGVAKQAHTPGDPFDTAFNEGRRRVGLRIASIMGMSDEQLAQREQEEAEDGWED